MAKMFKPNKSNLIEAIGRHGEFKDYRKWTPIETEFEDKKHDILRFVQDIENGNEILTKLWAISLRLKYVQAKYLERVPSSLWHGEIEQIPNWFKTAHAYFELSRKIMHSLDLIDGFSYEKCTGPLGDYWNWRCWSLLGGATEISDQYGIYLYNSMCVSEEACSWQGSFPVYDWPTRNFIRYVEKANLTGRWPEAVEIDSMGWYRDIVRHAGTSQFAQAVDEFCDTRIAHLFRFDSLTSEKRNKYELLNNIRYCNNPSDFVPLELHMLSHVHQRCRGSVLDFSIPHPLLDSPIASYAYPKLLPIEEDETLRMVRGYVEKFLAPHWNPDLKFEVVYPL
jgi:hypothetical protein